ncbi:MAG TPA: HAD-IA family hydrolase [Candidatus Saccharimonadales bacterium]|nr:HAD-IA family hydrolase [Candidatus Saccharimonadales bacterium]
MIKAILFDLDGTIHDSRDVVFFCMDKTFQQFGLPTPSREAVISEVHAGSARLFAQLAPENKRQEMLDYFREIYKTECNKIEPYENAQTILKQLHEQGYRLGIVSSARAAEDFVKSYGLGDLFDVIVGGNTTAKHKPDPEPVLFALHSLGVSPKEAIIVGDLPADIEAGRAAGLKALVAITHGFGSRQLLAESTPDYLVDSFADLHQLVVKGGLE